MKSPSDAVAEHLRYLLQGNPEVFPDTETLNRALHAEDWRAVIEELARIRDSESPTERSIYRRQMIEDSEASCQAENLLTSLTKIFAQAKLEIEMTDSFS